MKRSLNKPNIQFIVDAQGKKQKIIMNVADFEKLIEKLEDLHDIATAEQTKKRDKQ